MKKDKKFKIEVPRKLRAFITQPISQADKRQEASNIALPDDENVLRNRRWIAEKQM